MTVNIATVGPGLLTIGSAAALTNFSSQMRSARIVPSVSVGDPIDVLSGETVPGDRTETFALVVSIQSDFGHNDSRVEWLWKERGKTHPFAYIPNNALGRRITGSIIVEPIEIGGDVKSKPAHEVTMQLVGAPVFDKPA